MSLVGWTLATMSSNMQKARYVKLIELVSRFGIDLLCCSELGQPEPLKRRSIMCVDQNEMALPDTRCTNETKPHDTDQCGANLPYCNSDDNSSESNMI